MHRLASVQLQVNCCITHSRCNAKESFCSSFPFLGVAEEQQCLDCATNLTLGNPAAWGQLARDGHEIVQFKDSGTNRFVAVAVDG